MERLDPRDFLIPRLLGRLVAAGLFPLQRAEFFQHRLKSFGDSSGVEFQSPLTIHLELLPQSKHRLFSVGHELLQVLIPQLLASTALPRTLPASFELSFHVRLVRRLPSRLASPLAPLFPITARSLRLVLRDAHRLHFHGVALRTGVG